MSGCGGGSRPAKPDSREAARIEARELKRCTAALDHMGVRYSLLPDRSFGGGCAFRGALQLLDIGTPVTGLTAMRCALAERLTLWIREDASQAARAYFGTTLVRVQSYGSYACRSIAGSSRLSQHASANAVDIAAFRLGDGRVVAVRSGWNGAPAERAFLRAVRAGGCRRFPTVLSPDYNADHADHLHFDMSGTGFCR